MIAEDADRRVPFHRRRRAILVAAAIGLVVLAIVAWRLIAGGSGDAKPTTPALPHVSVIVPGRKAASSVVTASGSIAARREMPVGIAGEGGMVSAVLVEPGQWVAAGQTLATIERSVQTQEARSLSAGIAVAQADAALAQSELDRARQLVSRGFISKADIDRKTAARDAANARVAVARAQLGEQNARIGRLVIRAPAAGLVLTRAVEPGQVVGAGAGALFRMAKDGEMELLARMAEQDLARLNVGVPAQVVPVGSSTVFPGRIWQISPIIDPQTRQGTARIALAFNRALRPGGFANATITSGAVDAPLLPESAVQNDDTGSYVLIVGADGTVIRRDVKVGDVSEAGVTIVSGISGSERVILTAGAFLNPGEKVVPERVARPS